MTSHSIPPKAPAPLHQLRDLELLLVAHHAIIFLETGEEERAESLLEHVADHLDLLYLTWTPLKGLEHRLMREPLEGTREPIACLEHIARSETESLYYLRDFVPLLEDAALRSQLKEVHRRLWRDRGAVLLTGPSASDLPKDVARLVTTVALQPPSDMEYHQYLSDLLRDLRTRNTVRMELTAKDVARLITMLRGLTFFEVRKVISQAIAENWSLDKQAITRALEAKKQVLSRTGVLEYSPAEHTLADIAGLEKLKAWLRRRKAVFSDPTRAKEFGLSAPRGILLLGVPGCGKSLCAKAVASEYALPLIRLDPARLYAKYVGETEQNLRLATKSAEAMAPIVLWIDEIEKGLGPTEGGDAGVSQRVFGTFLSWLQDKPDGVFVVATANDITRLPPELLRKGRFDEIFFVDLPRRDVRRDILAMHLTRRGRNAGQFDLEPLVDAAEEYSGSELEQCVVNALYAAYAEGTELNARHILDEIKATKPLSVTASEKISRLREWAREHTVAADDP